jgi:hypothetical protein
MPAVIDMSISSRTTSIAYMVVKHICFLPSRQESTGSVQGWVITFRLPARPLFRAVHRSVAIQTSFNPSSSSIHCKAQLLLGSQIYSYTLSMILYVAATEQIHYSHKRWRRIVQYRRPSRSFKKVTNLYGYINSPDVGDPEAYVQV